MVLANNSDLTNQTLHQTVSEIFINPEILRRFQLICYGIISDFIAVFGIGTNIINIICFVKQGFRESININLLSLAISDMVCLLTVLWTNITLTPEFQDLPNLPFIALDTMYLLSGMPHVIFTRITALITAFITLERCLCITMPLKVARVLTSNRIVKINVCIYSVLVLSASPIYVSGKLGMRYYPAWNRTVVAAIFTKDRVTTEKISSTIHSIIVPLVSLSIITVCMLIMVTTLKKQASWRQNQQATTASNSSVKRDQRLVKMIVMISTLFVVSFCPSAVLFLMITLEPEFNYPGKYNDVAIIVYGFSTIAETLNSSMNIFIYYRMSTRYRTLFRQIFFGETETKQNATVASLRMTN